MSSKLYKLLSKEFPPTPKGYKRISIYPPFENKNSTWIERIHAILLEKEFLEIKEPLIVSKEIEILAKKIFNDVNFRFYDKQEEGDVIFFSLEKMDDYKEKYSGHFIEIQEPIITPKITISTGNRGSIKLHPKQREKYFQFTKEVYDISLERARNLLKNA